MSCGQCGLSAIYDIKFDEVPLNQTLQSHIDQKHFSGCLNIDELHLSDYTLLLATNTLADRVVGCRLFSTEQVIRLARRRRTLLLKAGPFERGQSEGRANVAGASNPE